MAEVVTDKGGTYQNNIEMITCETYKDENVSIMIQLIISDVNVLTTLVSDVAKQRYLAH